MKIYDKDKFRLFISARGVYPHERDQIINYIENVIFGNGDQLERRAFGDRRKHKEAISSLTNFWWGTPDHSNGKDVVRHSKRMRKRRKNV